MFLLILIAILFIWVLYVRAVVLNKQGITINAYISVDTVLKKQYTTMQKMFELLKNYIPNEVSKIEYAEMLKSEAISLGTKPDNIDRRIAIDGELKKNTEYLISVIDNNQTLKNNDSVSLILEEYNKNCAELRKTEDKYNKASHELRTVVEVFPYSFLARLNKVKTIDCIK